MKRQSGIWLDYKEAFIIQVEDENTDVQHLQSDIEDYRVRGGSRSRQPWGPMDKTSESKYLERRLHQTQQYFQRIMEAVKEADRLYVFGPAEAKVGLKKAIEEDKGFRAELLAVETADKMTQNQMVARVKAFFLPKR